MVNVIWEGDCCQDCLMLIANSDTSGNSRCETEEGEAAYLADVNKHSEGKGYLVPSSWPGEDWTDEDRDRGLDREGRFTMNGCKVCGSGLGGDRYPIVGLG